MKTTDLPEELGKCLGDGVVLCKLINLARPNMIPKFHQNALHTFAKLDNINQFVQACKSLRLPTTFTPIEIVEGGARTPPSVFNTLKLLREKIKR